MQARGLRERLKKFSKVAIFQEEQGKNRREAWAMSTSLDNLDTDRFEKLGTLLASLKVVDQEGPGGSSSVNSEELFEMVGRLKASISDLKETISANEREQKELADAKRRLDEEIQQLAKQISEEGSELVKAARRL
jgi:hypothetical protein